MDILKSNIVVGVSAALAVTVLAPVLLPIIATAGRPLAKSLLKGGLMLYEKSREAVAVAGESMEDMLAEIRAEAAMHGASPGPAAEAAAAQAQPQRDGPNGVTSLAKDAIGAPAPRAGAAAV
jgi:cell pole-organizing protein PopZ